MDRYPLEDLVAFRIAKELKDRIGTLLAPGRTRRDFGFDDQIRRAAESIASNIAEGHGRYNPAEFANFLRYSRASVRELQERLPDGVTRGYYEAGEIAPILTLLDREAAVLVGLRKSMLRLARNRRTNRT